MSFTHFIRSIILSSILLWGLQLSAQASFVRMYEIESMPSGAFMGNFIAHPDTGYLALSQKAVDGVPGNDFEVVISHLSADGVVLQNKRIDFWPMDQKSTFGKLLSGPAGAIYYLGDLNAGSTDSSAVLVARIDPNSLEPIWSNIYNNLGVSSKGSNAKILANGDLLVVGKRKSAPVISDQTYHPFIMRLDSAGAIKWYRQKRVAFGDATAILESPGGGLFIMGTSRDSLYAYGMAYMMHLDSIGQTVWTKTYAVANSYFKACELFWVDNGRIGAWGGVYHGAVSDVAIKTSYVMFDTAGTFLSAKIFTGLLGGGQVVQQVAGGYLETGYSRSYGSDSTNIYLLYTDSLGSSNWLRYYDGDYVNDSLLYSSAHGLLATPNDGYRIAGYGYRDSLNVNRKVFLLNTDETGFSGCASRYATVSRISRSLVQRSLTVQDTIVSIQPFLQGYVADSIRIYTNLHCYTDCVWPGDANEDGLVNHYDLLSIGMAYGDTGPGRSSISRSWTCHTSSDWAGYIWGSNAKHIDCMGDGTVNKADTSAILRNYSQTHNKSGKFTGTEDDEAPIITVLFPEDTAYIGDTIHASIWLGTALAPVDSIYGLAFNILYDNTLVDTNSAWITFDSSWFGDENNSLGLYYDEWGSGNIDAALTKIDHLNSSGYAEIATLHFILIDNIEGKRETGEALHLQFGNLFANGYSQNLLPFRAGGDSLIVLDLETDISKPDPSIGRVQVFPNPASQSVQIQTGTSPITKLSVLSINGQMLYEAMPHASTFDLDVRNLIQGIYLLKIETKAGVFYHKLAKE